LLGALALFLLSFEGIGTVGWIVLGCAFAGVMAVVAVARRHSSITPPAGTRPGGSGTDQSCERCGYPLTQLPLTERNVQGIRMQRRVCPECGHTRW